MGKEFKLANPRFIFKHNKKPLNGAYIYIDLPGTPEDEPAFELSEFKTDTLGKLGFLNEPEGSVLRIRDKEYNVFYSYKRIDNISTITEDKCQRVHMVDVIELDKRTEGKTKLQEVKDDKLDVYVLVYDEGDGSYGFYLTNNTIDYVHIEFYFKSPKNPNVEFDEPQPKGKATASDPYKRTFDPEIDEERFLVLITDDEVDFKYKSYYGDPDATSDGTLYALPYPKDKEYTVIQGFNGAISHKGDIKYAVDMDLDDETKDIVCATRGGVVVELEDKKTGTAKISAKDPGNFIRILHDDRTYSYYIHLKYEGIMVNLGDSVTEDDEIANPDHTGSSQEAHLHFDIRVGDGNGGWKTIEWKFKDRDDKAFTPKKGETYKK